MIRHALNTFSLVFGILLTLLAAWTAFAPRGRLFDTPQWRWTLPAAAILVGAALIRPLFTAGQTADTPGDDMEGRAPGTGR